VCATFQSLQIRIVTEKRRCHIPNDRNRNTHWRKKKIKHYIQWVILTIQRMMPVIIKLHTGCTDHDLAVIPDSYPPATYSYVQRTKRWRDLSATQQLSLGAYGYNTGCQNQQGEGLYPHHRLLHHSIGDVHRHCHKLSFSTCSERRKQSKDGVNGVQNSVLHKRFKPNMLNEKRDTSSFSKYHV
jgi:hypothetical protein